MDPTVPMTLFDLDAAGLDTTQPAPPEFIQFLYDNSRSGYLTLWSARLAEPDGAVKINQWVQDALQVYYSRHVMTQMATPGDKPTGDNVTEVTYGGPTTPPAPVCIDVPFVSGSGAVGQGLACTTGNWGNVPTEYAYQWQSNGAPVGEGMSTYTVADTDAGHGISCVVTATNAGGSTQAPVSNTVQVAAVARAEGEQAHGSRREYPKEEEKAEEKPEHHERHHERGRHRGDR